MDVSARLGGHLRGPAAHDVPLRRCAGGRRALHLHLDPRACRRVGGPARDKLGERERGRVRRRRPPVVVVSRRLCRRIEWVVVRDCAGRRAERDRAVADVDRPRAVERTGGEVRLTRPAVVADRFVASGLFCRSARRADAEGRERETDDEKPHDDTTVHDDPLGGSPDDEPMLLPRAVVDPVDQIRPHFQPDTRDDASSRHNRTPRRNTNEYARNFSLLWSRTSRSR